MHGIARLRIEPGVSDRACGEALQARGEVGELKPVSSMSGDLDQIVLVDERDVPQGTASKIDVHRQGLRHRALSVLVRNPAQEMLIHRRNPAKYHSGGLWTNACCSHPRPGEKAETAAQRRLAEEMGIRCALRPLFLTHYRATVSNGFIEDEVVHAFGGTYEGVVSPDPAEVSEWKWMSFRELVSDIQERPQLYTVWFRHYLGEQHAALADWMTTG
jgi:isopentenyl-diphosphate delta-isomerase